MADKSGRDQQAPAGHRSAAHKRAFDKQRRHADAVADGSMTEADIYAERHTEYAAHLKKLPSKDRATLNDWAERMGARLGQKARINNNALPWAETFMVARYGEEVEHWPTELSAADATRLDQMELGTGKALGKIIPLLGKRSVPAGHTVYGLHTDEDA